MQRAGSYAGRVKVLQFQQHLFYLLFRYVNVMVDSQLVGNAVQWFTQQSVIVQRPYEIFHDITLFVCKVKEVHLLYQLVVE